MDIEGLSLQDLEVLLESIFSRYNGRLSALLAGLSTENSRIGSNSSTSDFSLNRYQTTTSKSEIPFQIILGRFHLTSTELANLKPDVILPLLNTTSGRVQIWAFGKCCGEGTLLVSNGMLSVRLESFSPN